MVVPWDKEFTTYRQSKALVEYVVTTRPVSPSGLRISLEGLLTALKIVVVVANLVLLWRFRSLKTGIFGVLSCILLIVRPYQRESLLVLKGLGIEVYSSGRFYGLTTRKRFIPYSDVLDLLIQEAFIGYQVKHVLVIAVKGRQEFEVVFPSILPNLSVLEPVWNGAKKCLDDRNDTKRRYD